MPRLTKTWRKREIELSAKIRTEVDRIEQLVLWFPDIKFYNTTPYTTLRMKQPYGVRFGHLDTLKFLHVPYHTLLELAITEEWLKQFQAAAKTCRSFCGIAFE